MGKTEEQMLLSISRDNKINRKIRSVLFSLVNILLFSAIMIIKKNLIGHNSIVISDLFYPVIISVIISVYVFTEKKEILYENSSLRTVYLSLSFSTLLLILISNTYILPFWFLGAFVIAAYIDRNLGLMYAYSYLYLSVAFSGNFDELVLVHLIIISFLCIVAEKLVNNLKNCIYSFVNVLIICIITYVLSLFIPAFSVRITAMLLILVTYALMQLYICLIDKITHVEKNTEENEEYDISETLNFLEEIAESTEKYDKELEMQKIGVHDADELFESMKDSDPVLYKKLLFISELAGRLADEIGADSFIAASGCKYSKLGKLYSGNSIDNTIKILREKNFSEEFISAVESQDYRRKKANSPEAMIICVCSTMVKMLDYFKDNKDISSQKVIEKMLFSCTSFGVFDESQITMEQYGKIRNILSDPKTASDYYKI